MPGNIFWRPHGWLVIEWMAERDAVKPPCTTSCMLTACHKQLPIQKSQKTNSVFQATSPLLGITLLWVTTPCGQLLNFGIWGGYKMKVKELLINKAHFDFLRDAEKLWNNNLLQSSKALSGKKTKAYKANVELFMRKTELRELSSFEKLNIWLS